MKRGIKLDGKKQASLLTWTLRHPRTPETVSVLIPQRKECFSIPCVKVGDHVLIGEKIARPEGEDGISLHASISGTVKSIRSVLHPIRDECMGIEIESDLSQKKDPKIGTNRVGWEKFSSEEILEIFKESGLMATDKREIALHNKIKSRARDGIEEIIINGCESEPYVTSDHALMMSHPIEILKGAEILRKIIGAKKVTIAIEDNKLEVIELIKSRIYFLKWDNFKVVVLPAIYPQDDETILSRDIACLSRKAKESSGKNMVFSITEVFSVYEAVVLQKPFYERAVTVGGECVVEPRNLWLPMGLSFGKSIKACRGLLRDPAKVLMGGAMRGVSQTGLNAVVIPMTNAILALSKEATKKGEQKACIRCRKCVDACPVSISPAAITMAAEKGEYVFSKELGARECIECGNCSYVCPAKRPMLELMCLAKRNAE